MKQSMARESEITAAAERACKWLGLTLRDRQLEVVVKFVHDHDVFKLSHYQLEAGKSLCYECHPWTFDQLKGAREQVRSTVMIVALLIFLMKDRVEAAGTAKNLSSHNQ